MGNSNNKYTLHYFDIRGRGEIIRILFAAAGVEYVDNRIQMNNWPSIKATTPLGSVPFLEYEGQRLPQTMSIAKYLAREFGLAGKNNAEQAQADCVVETTREAFDPLFGLLGSRMKGAQPDLQKEYYAQAAPNLLGQVEKLIKLYGSNGYSVGSSLTFADLYIYEVCKCQALPNDPSGKILDAFPLICGVIKTVEGNQKVKNYIDSRPKRPL